MTDYLENLEQQEEVFPSVEETPRLGRMHPGNRKRRKMYGICYQTKKILFRYL